jgi:glycerol-3-phosphate O-acyltransferase
MGWWCKYITTGDIVGCIYDSNAGSLTWYRNNVLLGTSTTAVMAMQILSFHQILVVRHNEIYLVG